VSTTEHTEVLRAALIKCLYFLNDPRICTYQYMEGSEFYTDLHEVVTAINDALTDEQKAQP